MDIKKIPVIGLYWKYRDLQKSMLRLKAKSERPPRGLLYRHAGIQIPILPIHMMEVYLICRFSSVMNTVTTNLKNEIFRRGLIWRPTFNLHCDDCGFDLTHEKDKCPKCGGKNLRKPKMEDMERLDSFIDKCNASEQSLVEVFKECEYDLDIIDDCYVVLVKDYITDKEGNIEYNLVREILRGDPIIMRMVTDKNGELGGTMYTCVEHRLVEYKEEGTCTECGRKLHEVHFVAVEGGSDNKPMRRYIQGEVIHTSKYFPSTTYGFPPVISIWKEISILQHMNNYINDYYQHMRMPRGVVLVTTNNIRQTFDTWDVIQERVEDNPAYLPLIPVQQTPDGGVQGRPEFVKFMDTLMEMQYIQAKDDLRQRISALYGVTNILMNDPSASGGLNQEGLMIKVTDRSIESGQGLWNGKVLPVLCREFGVKDYVLQLRPNEEEDEIEELQIDQMKITNAQAMHAMGFDVELDEDGKPTKFSGEAMDPSEMGGGGLGGMLGGSGPTPPMAGSQQSPHALRDFNRSADPIAHSGGLTTKEASVLVNKDELIIPLDQLEFTYKGEKVYLKPGEEPPTGTTVQTGPKGGKYYDSDVGPSNHIENGEPQSPSFDGMKFYHGTSKDAANYLTEAGIDEDMLQRRDHGFFGEGFYVAKYWETARTYGGNVVEITMKPESKLLDAGEQIKEGVSPSKKASWHGEFMEWYKNKVITKGIGRWEDKWADNFDPESPKFDRYDFYRAVASYATETDYDVVRWVDSEIIILNPESVDEIKKAKASSSTRRPVTKEETMSFTEGAFVVDRPIIIGNKEEK